MTAEREAMTPERKMFEKWADGAGMGRKFRESMFAAWQGAIASLSGAAEPVARRYKDSWGHWRYCGPLSAIPEILKAEPLYTHPSEDARDAARWRWLKQRHADGEECDWIILGAWSENLDAEIDAAMEKENGK